MHIIQNGATCVAGLRRPSSASISASISDEATHDPSRTHIDHARAEAFLSSSGPLYRSSAHDGPPKSVASVTTFLVFYEVDDVDLWLGSPRREEVFGPPGMTARLFITRQRRTRSG
jgi:hypothetical protein